MGFKCCVAIARNCCKNAPTVSHSRNILAYFWGVMRCRCVIHSRIFEGKKIFRKAGSHSSNKTKSQNWRPDSLKCSFFTLYFVRHNFVTSVLTYFHWNQFSRKILLELWSDAIWKVLFFPSITILIFRSSWHCNTLFSTQRCGLHY